VRIGRYRVPLGGDIIVAVNGTVIADSQDLTVYLETQTSVGDTVALTIVRDGSERTLDVTLGERVASQ
jgi:S1-C subfamily serine protease